MKAFIGLVALFTMGIAHAAPVTIDFEGVATGEFSTIEINGYRFAEFPNYSNPRITQSAGNQYMSVGGAGNCGDFGDCGFVSVVMTRVDGSPFSFLGADITTGCLDEIFGSCSNGVSGIVAGGGGAADPVGTGDWLNLTSVRFSASGQTFPGGIQGFSITVDNIVVSAAVPVPAAVWLFGSALAVMGWLRRQQGV